METTSPNSHSDPTSDSGSGSLDVMIITHNERLNLPHCLRALQGWTRQMFVVDSGSTDGTQEIARSHGARLEHHDWPGYAAQKNWGLDHLPLESPWILILDADEVVTADLRERLLEIVRQPIGPTTEAGYFINRLPYFLDMPIRHCGMYPNWNLRLFQRGRGRYEDRAVHEHLMVDGPVGYIRAHLDHHDRRGLEHYIAKHNRYSTLEARSLFEETMGQSPPDQASYLPPETLRRRWLKRNVMPYLPLPGFWRFIYMYVLRLGFLDGRTGFQFCAFIGTYDSMVVLKLCQMKRDYRQSLEGGPDVAADASGGLAQPEGALMAAAGFEAGQHPRPIRSTQNISQTEIEHDNGQPSPALDARVAGASSVATLPHTDQPTDQADQPRPIQTQPESSPWGFTEKVFRALWMLLGKPLFRFSFHNWYRYRNFILRRFGASIGEGVTIRPTVNVEIPWMLHIDDQATVGDHAILYSLGHIRIGRRTIVSQYAHLCAGTHDYTDHRFKLLRSPVVLGDDCWIGTDAFVGPGVHVGDLTVLGARASAYKNLPPAKVCMGNPARAVKERVLV